MIVLRKLREVQGCVYPRNDVPAIAGTPENILTLYEASKDGQWDQVFKVFAQDPSLGATAARFVNPRSGWTMLHQAAFFNNTEAAKLLIRHGAQVNATNADKRTAADEAVLKGAEELGLLISSAEL